MLVFRRLLPPHLALFLFLTLFSAAALTSAYAQPYWQATVTSDGTVSVSASPGSSQSAAWGTQQAAAIFQHTSVQANQTLTLTTSSTYHVRFNWIAPNGEPAPKNVVAQTYSNAYWSGPAGRSQGSADNGLGTPQVVVPFTSGTSQETKYSVMDGSSGSVCYDVQVSSTITAVGQSGSPYSYSSDPVQAQTVLTPQLFVVRLYVVGTIKDTNGTDNILIGQGCGAYISIDPTASTIPASPFTFTMQEYTVTGKTFSTFVGYVMGKIDPSPADGNEQRTMDNPSTSLPSTCYAYAVKDRFNMYEMYLPPGSGSQWVPLKVLNWGWTVSGSRNVFSSWQPDPPSGSVNVFSVEDCRDHPRWNNVFR